MYKLNEENLLGIAKEATSVCKKLNLNIADRVSFVINKNALSFAGKCHKNKDGSFKIEICERFANANEVKRKKLVEVAIHELIHTIPKCMNHGKLFKENMYKVNYATDYNVSTREDKIDMSEEKFKTARFIFECKDCNTRYSYQRACSTVTGIKRNPEDYRCGCCNKTGTLMLIEQDGKTIVTKI